MTPIRIRHNLPPLYQFRDEMDRLFSNFITRPSVANAARLVGGREFPLFNVWETSESVIAECELPGVKSEDLDIQIIGDQLTIKGTRQDDAPQGSTFHRRERVVGSFERVLRLPAEVNSANTVASLRDGILQITLPKAETAKPRKVQVQTG
ncbi:MAG: Hsp20/alpha crystallin family protein [Planctomycetota bacterium]|nr:Hsp20/alpha crystallin family protein [Planctomycetota bacterium]